MESGVLRNECEPEARAAGSRVHRKSGPPPPVRSDPTLNAWARHCTALQAQCFTGPTLQSGNTQARGGTSETSLLPAPTPEAWAPYDTALQAQCFTGPTLRVGITKKPRGKATLINLSFPLVPFPHAVGVGPYTTLRFKRSASPGPLFRVGRNRGIFSVRTLLESGHADHSVDRDTDVGAGPTGQRPGGLVHLLDPWTGG